jgi:hypothetical protein
MGVIRGVMNVEVDVSKVFSMNKSYFCVVEAGCFEQRTRRMGGSERELAGIK